MKILAVLTISVFLVPYAWAVNKCTRADGKFVFQDAPCAPGTGGKIDVRPATGAAIAPEPLPAGSAPRKTEAERLDELTAASQKDRRRWDLRDRLVPQARDALSKHQSDCAAKQRELADRQYEYRQNLYGKTHAAQMASEMAANASLCDTKQRDLKETLDTVQRECEALSCMRR